jgi:glyoxylase-like metal-dependent hydrolase (beta-lactamase superfamily II)
MARQSIPGITEIFFPKALVNAFVIRADVPTLIDTGTPGGTPKLVHALSEAGLAPRDVGRVLLTHRHADHAGNAAELARTWGAEVHVAPAEAPYAAEGREQPLPRAATPLGRALVPYVKVALPWRLEPMPVQESLVDGAQVGPFRVIATPGHTAGHVSLLWERRGILFTGDAAANITRVGPHPASDDPERARESFGSLAGLDFAAACFGHGQTLSANAAARFRAAI